MLVENKILMTANPKKKSKNEIDATDMNEQKTYSITIDIEKEQDEIDAIAVDKKEEDDEADAIVTDKQKEKDETNASNNNNLDLEDAEMEMEKEEDEDYFNEFKRGGQLLQIYDLDLLSRLKSKMITENIEYMK
ncbi:MAG: hypothetical protein EZS28_019012 [Streblomastix strix]|uniref:Uncharacterized protein n=1 Tax=Streblomastix strix TaxID=222440 RepID=A0A5J4VS66_9EUKA|nr:MAG: hypothetical protein EZS28_019012 [Streblomastix strix]